MTKKTTDGANEVVQRALIGAAIGGAVATLFLPGVGTLAGAKLGAFIGGASADGGVDLNHLG